MITRGIDFSVSHSDSAYHTLRFLEQHFGFRSSRPLPDITWGIRVDFKTREIYFNQRFDEHFENIIIDGYDCRNDEEIIKRAFRDVRNSSGFDHRLRQRPIIDHAFRSHNDHIDALSFALYKPTFSVSRAEKIDFFASIQSSYASLDKKFKQKFKQMQIEKTEILEINGKDREVKIVVLTEGKKVRAGYSVRMPQDESNEELGTKIAVGRAKSDKTNLIDMELGKGFDEKFILYAIAESLLKKISVGVIKIKGVK